MTADAHINTVSNLFNIWFSLFSVAWSWTIHKTWCSLWFYCNHKTLSKWVHMWGQLDWVHISVEHTVSTINMFKCCCVRVQRFLCDFYGLLQISKQVNILILTEKYCILIFKLMTEDQQIKTHLGPLNGAESIIFVFLNLYFGLRFRFVSLFPQWICVPSDGSAPPQINAVSFSAQSLK